jgi:plastocyanin
LSVEFIKKEKITVMKRSITILGMGLIVVTLFAAFAAWSGAKSPAGTNSVTAAAAGPEIEITNFSFAPATVTVPAGTQVTWTNKDEIGHNVVTADKSIKSNVLDTNEKFTFTFTKPGTYSYICTLHPRMKGTVVVQ